MQTRTRVALVLVAVIGAVAACAPPVPPPFDPSGPIRAAFYYPWFPETWHADEAHYPTAGEYHSSDPATLRRQITQAQYAGLDAFISSWWGVGTLTDQRLPLLLDAARAQGFRIAPYYEPEGIADPSVATIKADLAHLKSMADRYGDTWLRVNGKPVIFVYNANDSSCGLSQKWKDAAANWYVNLKVFEGYRSCSAQPDSWHQYGPTTAIDNQLPYSSTISPGFQLHGTAERLARNPARFAQNVADMAASKAKWQLVVSFNEWGEGTAIEPSPDWQSSSGYGTYLDLLHRGLGSSGPIPTTTPSTTNTTRPTTTTSTTRPPVTTPTTSPPTTSPPTTSPPTTSPPTTSPPTTARATKVLVFVEENHSLNQMQSAMPYLFSIAQQHSYATNYTAITHPSEPNYIAIASGSTMGDTSDHNPAWQTSGQSVFGQAVAAGKSAKIYAESMNSPCQLSDSGPYKVKHNPWPSFRDERAACNAGNLPMGTPSSGRMHSDVVAGALPNVGMAVPNICNDAHDCSLGTADSWLRSWLPQIMAGPDYTSGRLAIVVTADEDDHSSGNKVLTVVIHASDPSRVVSSALNHYSLTGFYSDVLGTPRLRSAASAPSFAAAFGLN